LSSELLISPPLRCGENQEFETDALRALLNCRIRFPKEDETMFYEIKLMFYGVYVFYIMAILGILGSLLYFYFRLIANTHTKKLEQLSFSLYAL
jgi:hypothetical protein